MLFSYVVARDYGFAPNPFHATCTLATCKPIVRRVAMVGDWIVGTGTAKRGLSSRLVFVMCVDEALTFDQYWRDPRFLAKRPVLNGSLKVAYGDNIYHRTKTNGRWIQSPSHHSLANGKPNAANIAHDTQTNRVLISTHFTYWGGTGPTMPVTFRGKASKNICATRGHKNKFSVDFVRRFLDWYTSLKVYGYAGEPAEWKSR